MAYSKAKLKSNGDRASPCSEFWLLKINDKIWFLTLFWTVEVFQYSTFTRHSNTTVAYAISGMIWLQSEKKSTVLISIQPMIPYSLRKISHFCLPTPSHSSSEPTFVYRTHDIQYCLRTTSTWRSWQQAHVIQSLFLRVRIITGWVET